MEGDSTREPHHVVAFAAEKQKPQPADAETHSEQRLNAGNKFKQNQLKFLTKKQKKNIFPILTF